jgi:hypothetical protein
MTGRLRARRGMPQKRRSKTIERSTPRGEKGAAPDATRPFVFTTERSFNDGPLGREDDISAVDDALDTANK